MRNKAFKAGIGYIISNILLRSIGIITLPLFTRLLTTYEYGRYSVFISYSTILLTIMGGALHASIQSANKEFPEKINEYTSTISLVYFINLAILILFFCILPERVFEILGLSHVQVIILLIYSSAASFMNTYNARLSLEYSYKKYLLLAIFNSLGSIIFSVVIMLTLFNNDRFMGRIIGQTMFAIITAGIALIDIYKNARPRFIKRYLSFGIQYCIPLIPHGIAQTLLAQFDRIMIKSMVGESEAGIYSFAGNIKVILTVVSNSLITVWTTWFFSKMVDGKKIYIQNRAKQLVLGVTIFLVCVMGVAPELIKILGSTAFWDAKYTVFPMILDSYILFLYSVIVQSEYYAQKTNYVFIGTVVATVLNIVTNVIFIEKYGYIAAAYTTLFSYICYLILHIVIAKKILGFHILKIKDLFIVAIISFGFAGVCLLFVDTMLVRWSLMIIVAFAMSVYLIKILADEGELSIREYIKKTVEKVRGYI